MIRMMPNAIQQITIACCTVPDGNRFLNAPGFSPRGKASMVRIKTNMVVTLTPPPVEPGEAPMYIKTLISSKLALEKSPTDATERPDVLEVMPIKSALIHERESPSRPFNNNVLLISRKAETVNTILVCRLNL